MDFELIFGTLEDDVLDTFDPPPALFDGSFDIVFLGAGEDEVLFSEVSDPNRVFLGDGGDEAEVGPGSTVRAGAGADVEIFINPSGLPGSATVFGGTGDDSLFIVDGSNQLFGGAGDDTLIVSEATGDGNLLVGGSGADTFQIVVAEVPDFASVIADFDSAEGDTIFIDGVGVTAFDELLLDVQVDGTLISLSETQPLAFVLGVTDLSADDFTLPGGGDAPAGTSTAPDVAALTSELVLGDGQTVDGTADADTFIVEGSTNIVNGDAGDDDLNIAEGTGNVLNGDAGDDILDGSDGTANTLDGGDDDDTLFGGLDDTLSGGLGDDRLIDANSAGGILFDLTDGGFDTVTLVTAGSLPPAPSTVDGFVSGQARLGIFGVPGVLEFEDLTLTDGTGDDAGSAIVSIDGTDIAVLPGIVADDLGALDFFISDGGVAIEEVAPVLDVPAVDAITLLDFDADGDELPELGDILGTVGVLADDRAVLLELTDADGEPFPGLALDASGNIVIADLAALTLAAGAIADGPPLFDLLVTATNPTDTVTAPLAVPFNLDDTDDPPFFDPNNPQDASILRTAATGDVVVELAAVDPDGLPLVFSLVVNDAAGDPLDIDTDDDGIDAFAIDDESGVITVTDADDLLVVADDGSFAIPSQVLLEVTVADTPLVAGNDPQTAQAVVTLAIEVDNQPPVFDPLPPAELDLPVTSSDGATVFDFDAEEPGGGPIEFAIAAGNADPDGDGVEAFAIDADSGLLSINDSGDLPFLGLELGDPFTLEVTATNVIDDVATASIEVNLTGFDLDVDSSGQFDLLNDTFNVLRGALGGIPVETFGLGEGTPPGISQQLVSDLIAAEVGRDDLDIELSDLDFDQNGAITVIEDVFNLLRVTIGGIPTETITVGADSPLPGDLAAQQAAIETAVQDLITLADPDFFA